MQAAALMLLVLSVSANAQRLQCQENSDKTSIRMVQLTDSSLTVLNPKTPRVGGPQLARIERRGDITKAESDAWVLYHQGGAGTLKNKTFGDSYTCIQIG